MDHLMALNNTPYNFYDKEIISPDPEEMNVHRMESRLTDLILCTPDGNTYPVHKIIISTRCRYFKGLFHSGLMESTLAEIQLDRNISEEIINYIYTGHIEINAENAFVINEQANFFLLTKLKEASGKVLNNNINIENILTLWRWAGISLNNELKEQCLDFILKNTETYFNEYLLSLKYDEITIIATNTDIADDKLYLNLVKWIKDDFENRQNYIEDLLNHIDFAKLSDDFKTNEIETDEMLIKNIRFSELMTNIVLNKKTMGRVNQPKTRKYATDLDDLVFAILRTDIAVLNLKKPYPRIAPIIQHDFDDFLEPIYCKEDNILFCGVDYKNKECKSFSYRTKVFNDVSPMFEGRTGFGITKLNDKIYVCGGANNNGTVEIYDYNIDKWIYGKSMSKNVSYFTTVNYNHSVYAFGGQEMYDASYRDSKIIQRYDPRENIWEVVCFNAIEMPYIQKTFVVNENDIKCFYDDDKGFTDICGYDVCNNKMFKVPSEIPRLFCPTFYQSKDNVYILGLDKDQNDKKTFGQLTNLSAEGPVEFTEFSDMGLWYYEDDIVKILNIGPDEYNFLDSMN